MASSETVLCEFPAIVETQTPTWQVSPPPFLRHVAVPDLLAFVSYSPGCIVASGMDTL